MQEKSKAQIAYETYNQSRGHIIWPRWSILTLAEANAWFDVVNAITPLPIPDPTADDTALILARRIASIAAETRLKPRMVWSIIDGLRWAEITAAEKATEAAAPQENPTDATDPAIIYAARIKAVMDSLNCDVNTARSIVINAEYSAKKAATNG